MYTLPEQIYLSIIAPLLALPLALYALLITAILLLLIPLRLCTKQCPSPTCFYHFLSRPPTFQLGLIFSCYDREKDANNDPSAKNITKLVIANILAPIYAVAIAVAAWVAAVFWTYTKVLGNPDGKEERDDGREAVLSVRGWWERWLVQGLN